MDSFPDSELYDDLRIDQAPAPAPRSEPQPALQFRDDLQRALEQTHRQQSARRTLGAHRSDYEQELQKEEQRRKRRTLSLLASLLMLLAWLWWRNYREA